MSLQRSLLTTGVGISYTYTSSQLATQSALNGYIPATHLVNLNWNGVLGYPVDASLFVTNLTQLKYPLALAGSYNSAGLDAITVGAPRTWGLPLRYRFGG